MGQPGEDKLTKSYSFATVLYKRTNQKSMDDKTLEKNFTLIKQEFNRTDKRFVDIEKKMDVKFNQVNKRLERVEKSLEKLMQYQKMIMKQRLDEDVIKERFLRIEERVTVLENKPA